MMVYYILILCIDKKEKLRYKLLMIIIVCFGFVCVHVSMCD